MSSLVVAESILLCFSKGDPKIWVRMSDGSGLQASLVDGGVHRIRIATDVDSKLKIGYRPLGLISLGITEDSISSFVMAAHGEDFFSLKIDVLIVAVMDVASKYSYSLSNTSLPRLLVGAKARIAESIACNKQSAGDACKMFADNFDESQLNYSF